MQIKNNSEHRYPEVEEKYHVFSDNIDEWVKSEEKAHEIIKQWKKEGFTNFRIYIESNWDEVEGIFTDEDCIYSEGSYPA